MFVVVLQTFPLLSWVRMFGLTLQLGANNTNLQSLMIGGQIPFQACFKDSQLDKLKTRTPTCRFGKS